MHWSTNDSSLIGTVIPTIKDQGGPGQAARDTAMTNVLLGMSQAPSKRELGATRTTLFIRALRWGRTRGVGRRHG